MKAGVLPALVLFVALVSGTLSCMAQQKAHSAETGISLPNLDWTNGAQHWSFRGQGKLEFDENFRAAKTPEGDAALELSVGPSSPEYLQRSISVERRDIPVEAGYYRLRFRLRTELTSGFAYPQIFVKKSDGRHADVISPETVAALRVSGKTPWTEYSVIYQMPPDTAVALLGFKADLASGSVTFSNVRLELLGDEAGRKLLGAGAEMKAASTPATLLYRDDFDSDKGLWIKDGTAPHWFEDGKLHVDCLPGKTSGMFTLWLNQPLSGDFVIAYDTMCLEPEVWNNLNFFLLGKTLDGALPTPGRFDSSYGQYHREAQTHIGTLTYKWSRMRKDPGFNLISEDQNTVAHVNRKYFFEIIKKGRMIEWRIDGKTAHKVEDEQPYENGLFAFRSADTKFWVDNFQIHALSKQ